MGKTRNRFAAGRVDPRRRGLRAAADGPVLLACEKCERRLAKEGRFRQISQLQQALDAVAVAAQADGSGLRILQVPCMDVCPKGAMAVADARFPDDVQIIRTPDDLREVCAGLDRGATIAAAEMPGVTEAVPPIDAR